MKTFPHSNKGENKKRKLKQMVKRLNRFLLSIPMNEVEGMIAKDPDALAITGFEAYLDENLHGRTR